MDASHIVVPAHHPRGPGLHQTHGSPGPLEFLVDVLVVVAVGVAVAAVPEEVEEE